MRAAIALQFTFSEQRPPMRTSGADQAKVPTLCRTDAEDLSISDTSGRSSSHNAGAAQLHPVVR